MKRTSWLLAILTMVMMIATHLSSRGANAQGSGPGYRGPGGVVIEASGELAVIDRTGDTVFRVQPNTGDRTIISDDDTGIGPAFSEPVDIAVEASRALVVVDRNLDALVRVDPVTGNRTVLSGCSRTPDPCPVPLIGAGPPFEDPVSVAVETRRGTLLVVDFEAQAVVRVDPVTGNRTILSSANRGTGPALTEPLGIAVQANGAPVLADFALDALVEINPVTGDRRILSGCPATPDPCPAPLIGAGPSFFRPIDVAVRPNRTLVVIDVDLGALIEVNPATGNRRIVSDPDRGIGPVFLNPLGVAVDRNRRLFVADQGRRAIIQVNPNFGNREIISQAPALNVSPPTGLYTALQGFDLVMIVEGAIDDVSILSATLNATENVTDVLTRCNLERQLTGSGVALRCPNADTVLGLDPGRYRFDVRLDVTFNGGNNIDLRSRVFWNIIGEEAP